MAKNKPDFALTAMDKAVAYLFGGDWVRASTLSRCTGVDATVLMKEMIERGYQIDDRQAANGSSEYRLRL